jgi:hypothetical protein
LVCLNVIPQFSLILSTTTDKSTESQIN